MNDLFETVRCALAGIPLETLELTERDPSGHFLDLTLEASFGRAMGIRSEAHWQRLLKGALEATHWGTPLDGGKEHGVWFARWIIDGPRDDVPGA